MNNNAKKKHMGKIVTVTGWGSGDGKTTIAFNLAGYFAKLGLKVLCVDESHNWNLFQMLTLQYGIYIFKDEEVVNVQRSKAKNNEIYKTIIPDVHVMHLKPFTLTLNEAKNTGFMALVSHTFDKYRQNYDVIIRDTSYIELFGNVKEGTGYSGDATYCASVSVISDYTIIPFLSYDTYAEERAMYAASFGTGKRMESEEIYNKDKVLLVPFGVTSVSSKNVYRDLLSMQKELKEKNEAKTMSGKSLNLEDVINKNYVDELIEAYTDVVLHDDRKAINAERRTHIPTTLNGKKSVFSEDIDKLCRRVESRLLEDWSSIMRNEYFEKYGV